MLCLIKGAHITRLDEAVSALKEINNEVANVSLLTYNLCNQLPGLFDKYFLRIIHDLLVFSLVNLCALCLFPDIT